MSLYSISLFLHIVGALGLFAVFVLEWAGLSHLRRAAEGAQVREWVGLVAAARVAGGPTALLILVTGIHMSAARWGPQGWILVGLARMVVIAVLSLGVSGRRAAAIARAPAEPGPISPPLRRQLHDPVLLLSLWLRTALFLGVVFVMATEPGVAGALAALAAAGAIGLAAAAPAWAGGRRQARMAGSER